MWRAEQKAARILTLRSHWSWFSSLFFVFFQTVCSTRRKAHHQLGAWQLQESTCKKPLRCLFAGPLQLCHITRPQNPRTGTGPDNQKKVMATRIIIFKWAVESKSGKGNKYTSFGGPFFLFEAFPLPGEPVTPTRTRKAWWPHKFVQTMLMNGTTIKFSSSIEKPVPSRNAPTPAVKYRLMDFNHQLWPPPSPPLSLSRTWTPMSLSFRGGGYFERRRNRNFFYERAKRKKIRNTTPILIQRKRG